MGSSALIITEDKHLAERITDALQDRPYRFYYAPTFMDGLAYLIAKDIAVTIIQLSSPWESSIHLLYPVRWINDTCIVAMLCRGNDDDKAHILDLADECIWLPLTAKGIAAIRGGMDKRRCSSLAGHTRRPFFYCRGLMVFPAQCRVFIGADEVRLTRTQYEIFQYLIRNRDCIVSRDQILEAVWNHRYAGENDKTVNVHVHALRQKLAEYSDEPYIETVRGFGYRFVNEIPVRRQEYVVCSRYA